MLLEIVCPTLHAVEKAIEGGAQRLELCADLSCGGITPSPGFVKEALRISPVPVVILLRIREGDFVYSESEKAAMTADVMHFVDAGVAGIVSGGLLPDRSIDISFVKSLVKACGPTPFVFHRAFDVCTNPVESMRQLHEEGVERILTAGQAPAAVEGLQTLSRLSEVTKRPTLLAGGGIRAEHLDAVLATGVDEVHSAAMETVVGHDSLGFFSSHYSTASVDIVKEMRRKLDQFLGGRE